MCVALIGGMDRLERHYISEAEKVGVNLKVFTHCIGGKGHKISSVDAVVVFTNKVSHMSKKEALRTARSQNIPVMMCHSCGISSLRDCLDCLKKRGGSHA